MFDAVTFLTLYHRISVPEPSLKHFQSIARRLYRIFAHAYFHHREIYESFEVSIQCDMVLSYFTNYIIRTKLIYMRDFCCFLKRTV